MKKTKNIVIATVLLAVGTISNQEEDTKDIIIEAVEDQTAAEPSATPEQEAIKKWNAHLESLKVQGQHWNNNSNIPTDSWKEEAISLAKEALDQDKTLADTLKSAFFNAITEKIKIEEDEFSASTYALIKEFDDAIDAYVTALKPTEEAPQTEPAEEIKLEPVVEQPPVTIEVEPTPVPPLSDEALAKSETPEPTNYLQEWNDQLTKITTTGNNENDNRNLLIKTYGLAKELLLQQYTGESLYSGFEYALIQHNANQNLFPININQAIEAFSAETGIAISHDQQTAQQEYNAAIKKQAEQQKQKETELKTAATVQEAIKRANISESDMQRLNKKLEERLALEEATRIAQQKETNAQIALLKQELASAHKAKAKETPEEQGIISKAIGAVKGAASAATAWWYGEESQEQKDIQKLDQERFKKLQEILKSMPLTPNEKIAIERNWNTFITHLRTFEKLNINDEQANKEWLTTIKQALEHITLTYNIISIADAMNIIKDAIKQYPESTTYINDIKAYLTDKQQKIIAAKQREEDAHIKKIREREQRRELIQRKQQNNKNENERIKVEQNIVKAYENEKIEWQQFLARIAQHKTPTEQDNITYTNQATEKAKSLLNPMPPVVLENKLVLEQQLKTDFTKALLQQQGNEHKVNIHKNMDQFNAAIDKMTR